MLVWTTQHCGGVSYTESVCTCSDYILVCEAMLRGNCTLVHCYTDRSPCPSPSPRHHVRLTAVVQCECVLTPLWCRCIPSSPPLPSPHRARTVRVSRPWLSLTVVVWSPLTSHHESVALWTVKIEWQMHTPGPVPLFIHLALCPCSYTCPWPLFIHLALCPCSCTWPCAPVHAPGPVPLFIHLALCPCSCTWPCAPVHTPGPVPLFIHLALCPCSFYSRHCGIGLNALTRPCSSLDGPSFVKRNFLSLLCGWGNPCVINFWCTCACTRVGRIHSQECQ